ncbi:hypothetical protein LYNGBM3L_03770 [Moorena producens 3L]|uniref:Uncharacterized protein n=1 Tax=Moorena producens 3L TaxID=489825 RepID=F4XJ27_9CYAN|nr:hypothetical protein LYNGBM3L_03770 [Moorena producens 3L]
MATDIPWYFMLIQQLHLFEDCAVSMGKSAIQSGFLMP